MSKLLIERVIRTSVTQIEALVFADTRGLLHDIGHWTSTFDASEFISAYPEISKELELVASEFHIIIIEVD